MIDRLLRGFGEALRLTRAGRLPEATAVLREVLVRRFRPGSRWSPNREGTPPVAGEPPPPAPPVSEPPPREPPAPEPPAPEPPAPEPPAPEPPAPEPPAPEPPPAGPVAAAGPDAVRERVAAVPDGLVERRPEPAPRRAAFVGRTYTNLVGSRDYRLYVPGTAGGPALPLVVMLHGCTQSPDDFAAGTRMNEVAEEYGVLVAYPEQSPKANAARCWNWFSAADQRRGEGEPSLLVGITRQIMLDHPVDPARVYVAGLSAGGATAANLGDLYPDVYAAIGVHSGLPSGAARDVASAFSAMRNGAPGVSPAGREDRRVPTIVFHGDGDETVNPRNGDAVITQFAANAGTLTAVVTEGQVKGGHRYSRALYVDADGRTILEHWAIHGAGHAWSGGSPSGTYTDPLGPDASREMLRFFLTHRLEEAVV